MNYITPTILSSSVLTTPYYQNIPLVPTIRSTINLNSFNPLSTISPIPSIYPTIPSIYPTIPSIYPTIPSIYPSLIPYQDINNDRHLKAQVTEYFFKKVIKNWLRYHYLDLYRLVNVIDNKASLIKNMSEFETNTKNDTTENGIKYEFIIDNFITKKDVYILLCKFKKLSNLNWWDLKKHCDKIRKFIQYKVTKYMKNEINNK
jgi:hypothetical protein